MTRDPNSSDRLRLTRLGIVCVLLLAGTSPLTASAAPVLQGEGRQAEDHGESADASAALQRSRKRILTLRGGTALRALTRKVDGTWQYKRQGKWRPLPPSAVQSHREEAATLKEAQRRLEEAGEDVHQRALCSRWMLEVGLLAEGFEQLDELFALEPDSRAVHMVLRDFATLLKAPRPRRALTASDMNEMRTELDELVRWSSSRGACGREAAALELLAIKQARADGLLSATLRELLFDTSVRRRAFAAHALQRAYPGEHVGPLLSRAVLDTSGSVREQASLALRSVGNEAVTVPVVKALNSSYPRVRTQAAEALGNMGYAAAVEPLISRLSSMQGAGGQRVPHSHIFIGRQYAYIQDFDVEVAQFQAVADPSINVLREGQGTDAAVRSIREVHFAGEVHAVRAALKQLTGEDHKSTRAWLAWWAEQGSASSREQR